MMWARILLAVLLAMTSLPTSGQDCSSPVGMNLTGVQDALVDVFKSSRTFWESDPSNFIWDTGEPLDLDENGYPTSVREGFAARTLLLEALPDYPAGTYTLLYDGEGTIELGMDAENPVFTDNGGVDNQIVFEVVQPTEEGIMVDITATDPDNYIRNIRIIRPDENGTDYLNTYQTQHFRPLLVERLRSYSVLRFMDWMGTNFSPVQTWDDRTTLSTKTWSSNFGEGGGMPVELLVELSNTVNASPWFNMPHRADDDYMTRFAEYVRENLNPDLNVYVEYSNEVWNGIFSDNAWWEGQSGQNSYAWAQAQERGWDCSSCDFWEPLGRWVAQRSVEMFDIWNDVFGAERDRIIKVLPIQNGPGNATPFTLDHEVNGGACLSAGGCRGRSSLLRRGVHPGYTRNQQLERRATA